MYWDNPLRQARGISIQRLFMRLAQDIFKLGLRWSLDSWPVTRINALFRSRIEERRASAMRMLKERSDKLLSFSMVKRNALHRIYIT